MATESLIAQPSLLQLGGFSSADASSSETLVGLADDAGLAEAHERSEGSAKKIAIVDDEVELCSLLSILISRLGYQVEFIAHDGVEIVQAILSGDLDPDLVIMDYRMPAMNGMEAFQRIRRFRPEIKMVIMSADDSMKDQVFAAELPFLQKPFSASELKSALKDAFAASSS